MCRYAAGDYAGQILQQCMDMIRYQPPATNLTVPTSAGYGENVTPGAMTAGEREQELWRRGLHVSFNTMLYHEGHSKSKLLILFIPCSIITHKHRINIPVLAVCGMFVT